MRKLSLSLLTLAYLAVPVAAFAQSTDYVDLERRLSAAQLAETGLDRLSAAQLAALNRVLRGDEQARATTIKAEAKAELQAQRQQQAEHSALAGLNDQPIKARITGEVSGWAPGQVFELDNGQQWKVLKGELKLRTPLHSPSIMVVPGIAGRWFLQVDEDQPKARVYRID